MSTAAGRCAGRHLDISGVTKPGGTVAALHAARGRYKDKSAVSLQAVRRFWDKWATALPLSQKGGDVTSWTVASQMPTGRRRHHANLAATFPCQQGGVVTLAVLRKSPMTETKASLGGAVLSFCAFFTSICSCFTDLAIADRFLLSVSSDTAITARKLG